MFIPLLKILLTAMCNLFSSKVLVETELSNKKRQSFTFHAPEILGTMTNYLGVMAT
jgi:hypothetical protein